MAATYHFIQDGVCKDLYIELLNAGFEKPQMSAIYNVNYSDHVFEFHIGGDVMYPDVLTGQILDPKFVRAARQKELEHIEATKEVRTRR